MRLAPAAGADLYCGFQRLRLGGEHKAPATGDLRHRRQTEKKKTDPEEYKNLQKRYRNILTRGEKELPPIPPRQNGKRGSVAKSDAHNLWERSETA